LVGKPKARGYGGQRLQIPDRFLISEYDYWRLNHRIDSALPGYLMLASKLSVDDLSEFPDAALTELGPLLASAQGALRTRLKPVRVYIGRYGHSPGYPIHFHLIPVYSWVEKLFWRDERYRVLERFAEKGNETGTDGAELTLFIWREFCERSNPPPIEGPSVDQTIAVLRQELATS
jgi:diadenosine tetraphosphate (Ap4A) HIT family hydrolase